MELLTQLVELFDAVFGSQYPPLRDIVCNVNAYLAVKAVEQPVWAHAGGVIAAVVVGELHKREKFGPDSLVVCRIGPQVVFNDLVQGLTFGHLSEGDRPLKGAI